MIFEATIIVGELSLKVYSKVIGLNILRYSREIICIVNHAGDILRS